MSQYHVKAKNYWIVQNFDGRKVWWNLTVEKSDEIWQIKHIKKFDEQNFDKLS